MELNSNRPSAAALTIHAAIILVCTSITWGAAFERQANAPYEPTEPPATPQTAEANAARQAWETVAAGLQGSWAGIDKRFARSEVPAHIEQTQSWKCIAWRGERVSNQIVLWSADGAKQVRLNITTLRTKDGSELPDDCLHARFVRYVLAEGRLQPDVIDTIDRLDMPAGSARPIWVSIDIPAKTRPGNYQGTVQVRAENHKPLSFEITAQVIEPTLPSPADWSFHLDLWQNPWATARYHNIKLWSPEHWILLEPTTRMLAEAGQKCITTTLIDKPWGTQTYDPYGSMVEWIRGKDGTWRYDYTVFDRYVAFCQKCGITRQINCYSMVPWGNSYLYRDEATGNDHVLQAEPGTPAYEKHWTPFLRDFVHHLKEKGWLDKTAIAMDERPVKPMMKLIAFLKKTAPELKIALAGNYHPEIKRDVHDYCIFIGRPPTRGQIAERVDRGWPTTFYVCCGPAHPNTFPHSPPAESTWLAWHAANMGYTGFLRWAYDSWTADPLYDTNHAKWAAGDCFMVYPGGRSSIRFERLREGIADFEKIRLLRSAIESSSDEAAKTQWNTFQEVLGTFTHAKEKKSYAQDLKNGKEALQVLSQRAGHLLARHKRK